jgi:hypothetical protein
MEEEELLLLVLLAEETLPSQYLVAADAVPNTTMPMAGRVRKRWAVLVFMVSMELCFFGRGSLDSYFVEIGKSPAHFIKSLNISFC